jgi:hypothetical protein
MSVKPLPARRARAPPHRLFRIERRFSGGFIEQFTHFSSSASGVSGNFAQQYDKDKRK